MTAENFGRIPRGIEVLVKKAAVDPAFRRLVLEQRAGAAGQIGLELEPSEAMMLRSVPHDQLEAIIARTSVPDEQRRAFLGHVAAAMLAALGVGASPAEAGFGLGAGGGIRVSPPPAPTGIRPDVPEPKPQPAEPTVAERVFRILREQFPALRKGEGGKAPEAAPSLGLKKRLDHPLAASPDAPPRGGLDQRLAQPPQPVPGPEIPAAEDARKPEPPIPRQTRLVEDLGAKPADLAALRKRLETEFEITIPYGSYKRLRTVGELIDYIEAAVRRKEEANKGRKRPGQSLPSQARPPVSRGIQPDRPGSFGIQPDGPPAAGGIRP